MGHGQTSEEPPLLERPRRGGSTACQMSMNGWPRDSVSARAGRDRSAELHRRRTSVCRQQTRRRITATAIHHAAGDGRSHADDGEVVLVNHAWTDRRG